MEKKLKEPDCPKCSSIYIMWHQWDDEYRICMKCKHNWKETRLGLRSINHKNAK